MAIALTPVARGELIGRERNVRSGTAQRAARALAVITVIAASLVAHGASAGAAPNALTSSAPSGTTALFSVVKTLNFGTYGLDPSIVAVDRTSLFLTGTFENANGAPASLIRIERRGLTVAARAVFPAVTSVAYGGGALWWATGAVLGNAGRTMTAGHGRLLVKVNSVRLVVLARFTLPAPTMLLAVARGDLWVATPANLVRVNPTSGAVVATVALGFSPVALAAS